MGAVTEISWCDATFNPWIGCERVSPACQHCYAEALDKRWGGGHWGKHAVRRITSDANWRQPLRWNRKAAEDGVRRRVFCASMADVFEARPELDEPRYRLWDLIEQTPHLDWLLLTKRPENVLDMVPLDWSPGWAWPRNAWVGVTVEDQRRAEERIPHLLTIPAPVRFLSCEPLLSRVDIARWLVDVDKCPTCEGTASIPVPGGGKACDDCFDDPSGQGARTRQRIHWVIAGGESGHGARPMDPGWVRSLRDQCVEDRVPFHFKQHGDWLPYEMDPQPPFWLGQDGDLIDGHHLPAEISEGDPAHGWWAPDIGSDAIYRRVGKKKAGRLLDGRTWDEFPDVRTGTSL